MSDKKGGMLAVVEVKGDPNYWVPCVAYPIGGSLVEVRIDGKPVQNCIDGRLFLDSDIYLNGDHFFKNPEELLKRLRPRSASEDEVRAALGNLETKLLVEKTWGPEEWRLMPNGIP